MFDDEKWKLLNASWNAQQQQRGRTPTRTVSPKKPQKDFWLDQISTAGGILGGIGGSFVAPIAGTAAGAGAGSALGEAIENAIMGEDLGKNVLQEGALGAVFGAGPLKLLKGAGAGAAQLAKGAGVSAAKESAKKAAVTPLRQLAGKSLTGTADNLAVKQFRLTPSQLSSYKTKFGEDAGKTIRKYGFTSADDVTSKGIQPLQQQFNDNVASIGVVSKQALQENFNSRIAKLAGGKASDNAAKAQMLKQEADNVLSKFGDTIDAKELNAARQEFDKLVNYTNKAADPAKYSVNKYVADSMRETLQKADPTGTLKNIGSELSKLRQLSANVAKQSELGRGSLPFGLGVTPGAVLGGVGGGPLGSAAGIASQLVVNSPTGRRALLKGTEKLGNKLSSVPTSTMSPVGIAGRVGAYGALTQTGDQPSSLEDAITNQSFENMATAANTMSPNMNMPSNSNMPTLSSDGQQTSNPFGYSATEIAQALMKAYAAGDAVGAKQLQSMYELASEYEANANANQSKTFNSAVAGSISDFNSSLSELDKMEQAIAGGQGSLDPIMGTLRSMNPYDTEQQTLQAMINKTRQIVGKALEGGVLRKEDEEKYKKILPTTGDTKEVALNKIQMIKAQLQAKLGDYSSLVGDSSTDLSGALMQAQGLY